MFAGAHQYGGAPLLKKFKIGASVASAGIPLIDGTAGVIPCTTTDAADTPGLGLDTATYSTTQATVLAAGGEQLVTVSTRADLVLRARISGAATDGTTAILQTNTTASAGGTVVTDATNVGTADFSTGSIYCITGANKGQSRIITSFSSATSFTVTVPFTRAIAVGDTFIALPFAKEPGTGCGNIQATTLFTEANQAIVSGTGLVVTTVDVEIDYENARNNSFVHFLLADHLYAASTI
jgi:hypothetical protein